MNADELEIMKKKYRKTYSIEELFTHLMSTKDRRAATFTMNGMTILILLENNQYQIFNPRGGEFGHNAVIYHCQDCCDLIECIKTLYKSTLESNLLDYKNQPIYGCSFTCTMVCKKMDRLFGYVVPKQINKKQRRGE